MSQNDTNQSNSSPQEQKGFIELLGETILPKVEMIAVIIFLFAILLKYAGSEGFGEMLGISLTTLAIVAYLNAFVIIDKSESVIGSASIKVGYISSSVILVGIMFNLLHLPGANEMLLVGLTVLFIAALISAYHLFKFESHFYKKLLIRFIVVLVAGVLAILDKS